MRGEQGIAGNVKYFVHLLLTKESIKYLFAIKKCEQASINMMFMMDIFIRSHPPHNCPPGPPVTNHWNCTRHRPIIFINFLPEKETITGLTVES